MKKLVSALQGTKHAISKLSGAINSNQGSSSNLGSIVGHAAVLNHLRELLFPLFSAYVTDRIDSETTTDENDESLFFAFVESCRRQEDPKNLFKNKSWKTIWRIIVKALTNNCLQLCITLYKCFREIIDSRSEASEDNLRQHLSNLNKEEQYFLGAIFATIDAMFFHFSEPNKQKGMIEIVAKSLVSVIFNRTIGADVEDETHSTNNSQSDYLLEIRLFSSLATLARFIFPYYFTHQKLLQKIESFEFSGSVPLETWNKVLQVRRSSLNESIMSMNSSFQNENISLNISLSNHTNIATSNTSNSASASGAIAHGSAAKPRPSLNSSINTSVLIPNATRRPSIISDTSVGYQTPLAKAAVRTSGNAFDSLRSSRELIASGALNANANSNNSNQSSSMNKSSDNGSIFSQLSMNRSDLVSDSAPDHEHESLELSKSNNRVDIFASISEKLASQNSNTSQLNSTKSNALAPNTAVAPVGPNTLASAQASVNNSRVANNATNFDNSFNDSESFEDNNTKTHANMLNIDNSIIQNTTRNDIMDDSTLGESFVADASGVKNSMKPAPASAIDRNKSYYNNSSFISESGSEHHISFAKDDTTFSQVKTNRANETYISDSSTIDDIPSLHGTPMNNNSISNVNNNSNNISAIVSAIKGKGGLTTPSATMAPQPRGVIASESESESSSGSAPPSLHRHFPLSPSYIEDSDSSFSNANDSQPKLNTSSRLLRPSVATVAEVTSGPKKASARSLHYNSDTDTSDYTATRANTAAGLNIARNGGNSKITNARTGNEDDEFDFDNGENNRDAQAKTSETIDAKDVSDMPTTSSNSSTKSSWASATVRQGATSSANLNREEIQQPQSSNGILTSDSDSDYNKFDCQGEALSVENLRIAFHKCIVEDAKAFRGEVDMDDTLASRAALARYFRFNMKFTVLPKLLESNSGPSKQNVSWTSLQQIAKPFTTLYEKQSAKQSTRQAMSSENAATEVGASNMDERPPRYPPKNSVSTSQLDTTSMLDGTLDELELLSPVPSENVNSSQSSSNQSQDDSIVQVRDARGGEPIHMRQSLSTLDDSNVSMAHDNIVVAPGALVTEGVSNSTLGDIPTIMSAKKGSISFAAAVASASTATASSKRGLTQEISEISPLSPGEHLDTHQADELPSNFISESLLMSPLKRGTEETTHLDTTTLDPPKRSADSPRVISTAGSEGIAATATSTSSTTTATGASKNRGKSGMFSLTAIDQSMESDTSLSPTHGSNSVTEISTKIDSPQRRSSIRATGPPMSPGILQRKVDINTVDSTVATLNQEARILGDLAIPFDSTVANTNNLSSNPGSTSSSMNFEDVPLNSPHRDIPTDGKPPPARRNSLMSMISTVRSLSFNSRLDNKYIKGEPSAQDAETNATTVTSSNTNTNTINNSSDTHSNSNSSSHKSRWKSVSNVLKSSNAFQVFRRPSMEGNSKKSSSDIRTDANNGSNNIRSNENSDSIGIASNDMISAIRNGAPSNNARDTINDGSSFDHLHQPRHQGLDNSHSHPSQDGQSRAEVPSSQTSSQEGRLPKNITNNEGSTGVTGIATVATADSNVPTLTMAEAFPNSIFVASGPDILSNIISSMESITPSEPLVAQTALTRNRDRSPGRAHGHNVSATTNAPIILTKKDSNSNINAPPPQESNPAQGMDQSDDNTSHPVDVPQGDVSNVEQPQSQSQTSVAGVARVVAMVKRWSLVTKKDQNSQQQGPRVNITTISNNIAQLPVSAPVSLHDGTQPQINWSERQRGIIGKIRDLSYTVGQNAPTTHSVTGFEHANLSSVGNSNNSSESIDLVSNNLSRSTQLLHEAVEVAKLALVARKDNKTRAEDWEAPVTLDESNLKKAVIDAHFNNNLIAAIETSYKNREELIKVATMVESHLGGRARQGLISGMAPNDHCDDPVATEVTQDLLAFSDVWNSKYLKIETYRGYQGSLYSESAHLSSELTNTTPNNNNSSTTNTNTEHDDAMELEPEVSTKGLKVSDESDRLLSVIFRGDIEEAFSHNIKRSRRCLVLAHYRVAVNPCDLGNNYKSFTSKNQSDARAQANMTSTYNKVFERKYFRTQDQDTVDSRVTDGSVFDDHDDGNNTNTDTNTNTKTNTNADNKSVNKQQKNSSRIEEGSPDLVPPVPGPFSAGSPLSQYSGYALVLYKHGPPSFWGSTFSHLRMVWPIADIVSMRPESSSKRGIVLVYRWFTVKVPAEHLSTHKHLENCFQNGYIRHGTIVKNFELSAEELQAKKSESPLLQSVLNDCADVFRPSVIMENHITVVFKAASTRDRKHWVQEVNRLLQDSNTFC